MLPIAQLNPAPEWVYMLGAIIVLLAFLAGFVLAALHIWKLLKGPEPEQKHSPSIDTKIRTEVSASEKRTGGIIGQVKAELREDQRQHREEVKKDMDHAHGRISGLRDEIKADYDKLGCEVRTGVDAMRSMYAESMERFGKIQAENEHQERQIIATSTRLDRHIEKGTS